jgi:hypothetical protein
MRASHADRERAVDVLKAGFAEGRLSKEEYEVRVGQVYAARTYADLAPLTADLPGGQLMPYPAAPWPTPQHRGINGLAVASLSCALVQPFTFLLSAIPAIGLGHMARREIRQTGQDGSGLATAGLVLGWAGAVVLTLILVFGMVAFSGGMSGPP